MDEGDQSRVQPSIFRSAVSRRECVGIAASAILCLPLELKAAPGPRYITPERFGAVGDGVTNDTEAFAAMAEFVNRRGGGAIVLRPTTYIVGTQARDPTNSNYSFVPAKIMDFEGCTKALTIDGNGARLRCADGLRFGTFDRSTGEPTSHILPYTTRGELASPYVAMISVTSCSGGVTINNLELDGNLANLNIGGPFGDKGRQIPADGIRLIDNNCSEALTQVYSHHHAHDGLRIQRPAEYNPVSVLRDLVCDYNARQGCSIVAGSGYTFVNSRFNHTGKAGLVSGPAAGVDIEAQWGPIRDLHFSNCEFSDNTGCGLVADSGDSEGATFDRCRFIGTTKWAAWPKKPRFRFANCQFIGAICNTFGDPDPDRAAQFHDCIFQDDPALSPTGTVYRPSYPIANLDNLQNMLFNRCRFELIQDKVLPWSTGALYNDCTMSQIATKVAYPRGTYTGVNIINGNVDLGRSRILGDVIVNGQTLPRTTPG